MVKNKILLPGDTNTVSPVFFVTKKPSPGKTASLGWLVFDYRKLNDKVKPLHFPIANIKNFFDDASQYSVFSILDVWNAFLSVGLTDRAKKRCGIVTPFGVYLPQRLPFGLKTSPPGFCYVMHMVLSGLPFAGFYMDDILVGGKGEADMTKNLITVFERLAKYNLKIQLSKIIFISQK